MFHPILAENNSQLTLCMTILNAILALLSVVRANIANDHSVLHMCICPIIILYFYLHILLGSEVRIVEGLDNRGWTV